MSRAASLFREAVANALRGLTLGQGALPEGHTVAGATLLALVWTCRRVLAS